MTHPNTEQFKGYLENPQSGEFKELRLHLAQCSNCRSQVNVLSTLQNNFDVLEGNRSTEHSIEKNPELEQVMQQQFIEQYVEDRLSDKDKHHTETIIRETPIALKAALHFASHSSAMNKELREVTGLQSADNETLQTEQNHSHTISFFTVIKQWFAKRTPPIWFTVPATALATTLVFFIALRFGPHVNDVTIAGYQDNAIIQFQQKNQTPGMGFFSKANKIVKPYRNIQVQLVGKDTLVLSWPEVQQAESYNMALYEFKNGQKIMLGEMATTGTNAEFKGAETNLDRRYEWILSGQTNDAEIFYARGGFVVNQ